MYDYVDTDELLLKVDTLIRKYSCVMLLNQDNNTNVYGDSLIFFVTSYTTRAGYFQKNLSHVFLIYKGSYYIIRIAQEKVLHLKKIFYYFSSVIYHCYIPPPRGCYNKYV